MKRILGPQQLTWFIDLNNQGKLNLEPSYQRKNVWTTKDRQYFLDTIFRNYPCPVVFLHKQTDDSGNTTYNVVDGKQRLETILLFSQNKIKLSKKFGDEKYDGKLFKDLELNEKRQFWDYVMVVDMVDLSDTDVINEIFDRLNRISKNLNKQELRHAQFDGWFITHVEKESEDPFWEKVNISNRLKSKRMLDNQFISELLMVILENKIVGFDQNHISEIYGQYDDISNPDLDFDEESFIIEKERIKKFLENMEDIKIKDGNYSVIKKWGRTANNFYTLWSVIALSNESQLSNPEIFSKKYDSFMKKISKMDDKIDKNSLSTKQDQRAYTYYANSRGASTDSKPRKERLNTLEQEFVV